MIGTLRVRVTRGRGLSTGFYSREGSCRVIGRTDNDTTSSRRTRWPKRLVASSLAAVAMRVMVRVGINMLRRRDRSTIYIEIEKGKEAVVYVMDWQSMRRTLLG